MTDYNICFSGLQTDITNVANTCAGFRLNEQWCKDALFNQNTRDYLRNNKNTITDTIVTNIKQYCSLYPDTDICLKVSQPYNASAPYNGGLVFKNNQYQLGVQPILLDDMIKFCNPDINSQNIQTDRCKQFCSQNVIAFGNNDDKNIYGYNKGGYCSSFLPKYCSNKYCKNVNDINNITCDLSNIEPECACMLPDNYYKKITNEFNKNFTAGIGGNAINVAYQTPACNFLQCSSLRQDEKNKIYPYKSISSDTQETQCQPLNTCINDVSFEAGGNVIIGGKPEIKQSCNFTFNTNSSSGNYSPEQGYVSPDGGLSIQKCAPNEYVRNNKCTPIPDNSLPDPCGDKTNLCAKPLQCPPGQYQAGDPFTCNVDKKCQPACTNPFENDANYIIDNSKTMSVTCKTIDTLTTPCENGDCLKTNTTRNQCIIEDPENVCGVGTKINRKTTQIPLNKISEVKGYPDDTTKASVTWFYEECKEKCPPGNIVSASHRKCIGCPTDFVTDQTQTMCLPPGLCVNKAYTTEWVYDGVEKYKVRMCGRTPDKNQILVTYTEENNPDQCPKGNNNCPKSVIVTCPDGQIADDNFAKCVQDPTRCPPGSIISTDKMSCIQCPSRRTNNDKTACLDTCPMGQAPDQFGKTCIDCTELGLISPDGLQCVSCKEYYPADKYKNIQNFDNTKLIPSKNGRECIYDVNKCNFCSALSDNNLACNDVCADQNAYTSQTTNTDGDQVKYCIGCGSKVRSEDCTECETATILYSFNPDTNECVETRNGKYADLSICQKENVKYDCDKNTYNCIRKENGTTGDTLEQCKNKCKQSIKGYVCRKNNKNEYECMSVLDDNYEYKTKEECMAKCGKSESTSKLNINFATVGGGILALVIFVLLGLYISKKLKK